MDTRFPILTCEETAKGQKSFAGDVHFGQEALFRRVWGFLCGFLVRRLYPNHGGLKLQNVKQKAVLAQLQTGNDHKSRVIRSLFRKLKALLDVFFRTPRAFRKFCFANWVATNVWKALIGYELMCWYLDLLHRQTASNKYLRSGLAGF